MKAHADAHRSERVFKEGDMVYLKLQPHVQLSVAFRSNQKLSFKFYRPYKVLQKVGSVAYKLDLPAHAQIHPVVHVSQLKQCISSSADVSPDLSALCTDPAVELLPEHIIERSLVAKGLASAFRIKVQWTGLPASLSTWKDEADLLRRYPAAAAWGQAAL
jgi:hypothetical protein